MSDQVVWEVKINLSELVYRFVQNEIKLSVGVSDVYSETNSESIWIIQNGSITTAAQKKSDAYQK